jgi:hypothetical protein
VLAMDFSGMGKSDHQARLRSLLNPRSDVSVPKHRDVRSGAETTP